MGEALLILAIMFLFGSIAFGGFVLGEVRKERRMMTGMTAQCREYRCDCKQFAETGKVPHGR